MTILLNICKKLNLLFIYFSLCIFAKFLMSFLKAQVTFLLNFATIFSAIRHNSSVLFLAWTYFCQRSQLKTYFLDFRVLESKFVKFILWNDKSIPLQILDFSSLPWHITPLQILSSYLFYFGRKDPIKVPILTLSSALVKMCQISQVFFQTTSQFFFKICISLQCHER